MSPEELESPIYAVGFKIFEGDSSYDRIVIKVGVRLESDGRVMIARVVRSDPTARFNNRVLDAVRQWRWCPRYAAHLDGRELYIPFDFKVRRIRDPGTF